MTRFAGILALSTLIPVCGATASDVHQGMLRFPDVSRNEIVFVYGNDLWIVDRAGGEARPLASPAGAERMPKFSPDGEVIAFMGNYDGGRDLYTIPRTGGLAHRVTHHPGGEMLNDWTPGGDLLFASGMTSGLNRAPKLFTVPPSGGLPQPLPVPYGMVAAISDDGSTLAYTPNSRDGRTWKRYQGGLATDIWLFDLNTNESTKITDFAGTDTRPMWHGSMLYYLSDGGPAHRLNIWEYNTKTGVRRQVTHFDEFDVKWPSIGPGVRGTGEIIFQNGSGLQLLDLNSGRLNPVNVSIPGDRPTLRPQRIDVSGDIQAAGISATGKRGVYEARGDIWTVPAGEGTPRNLTRTDGVAERLPAWSPDGKWIAYFSDASGAYELYITQSDGRGETRQLTNQGGPWKVSADWDPDSQRIVMSDKTGAAYLVDIDSPGEMTLIDQDPWDAPGGGSWSHDGRWLAVSRTQDETPYHAIWLIDTESGERHQVTSGFFDDTEPVFDRSGDWLYFTSQRNYAPTYGSLPIDTTWIYDDSGVLLAVPLREDVESPWAIEIDEEEWEEEEVDEEGSEEDEDSEADDASGEETPATSDGSDESDDSDDASSPSHPINGTWSGAVDDGEETQEVTVVLNVADDGTVTGTVTAQGMSLDTSGTWDDATSHLLLTIVLPGDQVATMDLTLADGVLTGTGQLAGNIADVVLTRSGGDSDDESSEEEAAESVEIDLEGFERRAIQLPVGVGRFRNLAVNDRGHLLFVDGGSIKSFDIDSPEDGASSVMQGVGGFDISGDGRKLLVMNGGLGTIRSAGSGGSSDRPSSQGMVSIIDPRAEWAQIFTDAWRVMGDWFYVANMHGVDWQGVYDHYRPMIDDCVTRDDVNEVIGEMIAELNVGHAYRGGGDLEGAETINIGMLGVDFELDENAYRIASIKEGGAWDSDARGPLSQHGVDVAEGDYLLAVNGIELDPSQDPWAAFVGTAGQPTTLTVSEVPFIDESAREVVVTPRRSENNLRFRNWIEANRQYVEDMTDGDVGYIYVPDTGRAGQNELVRQFHSQSHKKALIIDERWNGGGQIPTRFIELLNRPRTNMWARRDGNDWKWPPDSHQGPMCMLINGPSGSGGDMFPFLFRQAGLGKIIGTRTWGGLVGISGNPALIDGGYVAVPTFGFYENDGTWGIEGHGVDPDIEVIDDPAQMVGGADPQLDVAINLMLEELSVAEPSTVHRPADPDRSGMGITPEDK